MNIGPNRKKDQTHDSFIRHLRGIDDSIDQDQLQRTTSDDHKRPRDGVDFIPCQNTRNNTIYVAGDDFRVIDVVEDVDYRREELNHNRPNDYYRNCNR